MSQIPYAKPLTLEAAKAILLSNVNYNRYALEAMATISGVLSYLDGKVINATFKDKIKAALGDNWYVSFDKCSTFTENEVRYQIRIEMHNSHPAVKAMKSRVNIWHDIGRGAPGKTRYNHTAWLNSVATSNELCAERLRVNSTVSDGTLTSAINAWNEALAQMQAIRAGFEDTALEYFFDVDNK